MKKLVFVGIIIITMLNLCACSIENKQPIENEKPTFKLQEPRFIQIGNSITDEASIIVDTKTGVQYIYRKTGYAGGMTILVDENGKPLLYENEEEEE